MNKMPLHLQFKIPKKMEKVIGFKKASLSIK